RRTSSQPLGLCVRSGVSRRWDAGSCPLMAAQRQRQLWTSGSDPECRLRPLWVALEWPSPSWPALTRQRAASLATLVGVGADAHVLEARVDGQRHDYCVRTEALG